MLDIFVSAISSYRFDIYYIADSSISESVYDSVPNSINVGVSDSVSDTISDLRYSQVSPVSNLVNSVFDSVYNLRSTIHTVKRLNDSVNVGVYD